MKTDLLKPTWMLDDDSSVIALAKHHEIYEQLQSCFEKGDQQISGDVAKILFVNVANDRLVGVFIRTKGYKKPRENGWMFYGWRTPDEETRDRARCSRSYLVEMAALWVKKPVIA